MPSRGEEWHKVRSGNLCFDAMGNFSVTLKGIVKSMMMTDPGDRPSAEELLGCEYLQSDLERQLKWEKIMNERYKSLIRDYENLLKVNRKSSS